MAGATTGTVSYKYGGGPRTVPTVPSRPVTTVTVMNGNYRKGTLFLFEPCKHLTSSLSHRTKLSSLLSLSEPTFSGPTLSSGPRKRRLTVRSGHGRRSTFPPSSSFQDDESRSSHPPTETKGGSVFHPKRVGVLP